MHDMTATNLRSAYGGESMAHMRYIAWGEKAAKDGFPNVGRLFHAVSYAEQIHAGNHFRELRNKPGAFEVVAGGGFGLGATSENLAGAIEGELFEVNEMYPAYLAVAEMQDEKGAQRSMRFALETEKIHAALYQKAKAAVDVGDDVALDPILICSVCGWTHEGEGPAFCPICGASHEKYKTFA